MTKANPGSFFEDYHLGQRLDHATPRTVTVAAAADHCEAAHAPDWWGKFMVLYRARF
jgi:hypothetical protein